MKESYPKISVIIPTFNRGWIICEAIDSVLAQTYRDFELIVVDDGSHDGTGSLLNKYGNKIRVIRQDNRGVSAARNTGIRESKGALIALLDSDDLWMPEKLQIQAQFFQKNPDALICQTEEIWIRNGIRVNPKIKHRKPSGRIFEASLELCLVSPSAVMIHRNLFDQLGLFDESLPACEDYDLWLRASVRYPVYLIDIPLIKKRGGHEDQLSSMHSLDKYRIRSLIGLLNHQDLNETYRLKTIDVLLRKSRIYAGGCRKRGKDDEAEFYEKLAKTYE